MKILTTLTVSGGLNMASTAKDVFTIGTPLENNDGNVDDLYVYANADFKNNVILGSSSADILKINSIVTGNINLSGGTIYKDGVDITSNGANQINYYPTIVITSSAFTVDPSDKYERFYGTVDQILQPVVINLPDVTIESVRDRIFTFWNISTYYEMSGNSEVRPYALSIVPQIFQTVVRNDTYTYNISTGFTLLQGQKASLQSIYFSGSYRWLLVDRDFGFGS